MKLIYKSCIAYLMVVFGATALLTGCGDDAPPRQVYVAPAPVFVEPVISRKCDSFFDNEEMGRVTRCYDTGSNACYTDYEPDGDIEYYCNGIKIWEVEPYAGWVAWETSKLSKSRVYSKNGRPSTNSYAGNKFHTTVKVKPKYGTSAAAKQAQTKAKSNTAALATQAKKERALANKKPSNAEALKAQAKKEQAAANKPKVDLTKKTPVKPKVDLTKKPADKPKVDLTKKAPVKPKVDLTKKAPVKPKVNLTKTAPKPKVVTKKKAKIKVCKKDSKGKTTCVYK